MNKKIGAIALIFSIIWNSSNAQVEKQVEVTKSYIPEIVSATKLRLEPDMSDTVRLYPEIEYSITPKSIKTTLATQPYKPATVTYWEFNRPQTTYVKVGAGVPWASIADIYISNSNPNTNYFVGYLNHNGHYTKIKNDYADKLSSLNSQNRVGFSAGTYLRDRVLTGEIAYDFDIWSRYATSEPLVAHPTYQTISTKGNFGDKFTNFSKLNYNISLGADYLWNRRNDGNMNIEFSTKFGGEINSGILIAEVGYGYISGSDNYANNNFIADVIYKFDLNSWKFDIGARYIYDKINKSTDNYLIPQLFIRNPNNSKIQPFISIGGEQSKNNYGSLTKENPYILEGLYMEHSSITYDFRGGIAGILEQDRFSYNLAVGYKTISNALYWALIENNNDNYYISQCESLQSLFADLDFEYRPTGDLKFKFGGLLSNYTASKDTDFALGRPQSTLYLGAEYKIRGAIYGINFNLEGKSYTSLIKDGVASQVKISPNVKLSAYGEWVLKSDLSIFAEINNITNSKIYRWMGYKEYGIGVMAGVKMQF